MLPEVNQIQYHPWSTPAWHAAVAHLAARGIVTTAYNSLGGSRFALSQLEDSSVGRLAATKSLTISQLLLRWALAKGCEHSEEVTLRLRIAEQMAKHAH